MGDGQDPYDVAFGEGVGNWNLLVFNARSGKDPFWRTARALPEVEKACATYARTRYLGLLADGEVFARYQTLFVGTMQMDDEGYLAPAPWSEWHDKWIHAAMELTLRSLPLQDQRARPDWSFVRTPSVLRAVAARSRRKLDWGPNVWVKYGSHQFLRPALERGVLRISPASSYDDPSLNAARRDAELERVLTDHGFELTATLSPRRLSDDDRSLYTATVQSATDYYVFCMASGYELRLFEDFKADACLVITDPPRFARSLGEAAARQLPGWHYRCDYVRYFDPIQRLSGPRAIEKEQFAPFFCKHFRYSYQREIRAAWLPADPREPRSTLDHVFVELGRLKDYCEIIEL